MPIYPFYSCSRYFVKKKTGHRKTNALDFVITRYGIVPCSMNKRPFILIELLLAISILSVCIIPIITYPYYTYNKQLASLLTIEKERQAEVLFFDLLRDFPVSWEQVSFDVQKKEPLPTIQMEIDGIGKVPIFASYRLFVHSNGKKTKTEKHIANLWCTFILETEKEKVYNLKNFSHKNPFNAPYTFRFFGKKSDRKPQDTSKEREDTTKERLL